MIVWTRIHFLVQVVSHVEKKTELSSLASLNVSNLIGFHNFMCEDMFKAPYPMTLFKLQSSHSPIMTQAEHWRIVDKRNFSFSKLCEWTHWDFFDQKCQRWKRVKTDLKRKRMKVILWTNWSSSIHSEIPLIKCFFTLRILCRVNKIFYVGDF